MSSHREFRRHDGRTSFELGLMDSKSIVLTVTPWEQFYGKRQAVLMFMNVTFCSLFGRAGCTGIVRAGRDWNIPTPCLAQEGECQHVCRFDCHCSPAQGGWCPRRTPTRQNARFEVVLCVPCRSQCGQPQAMVGAALFLRCT